MLHMETDLHTHTIASDHAYCTLLEMVSYAKEVGLRLIATTDHAPAIGDAPHIWHFHNLKAIPREVLGIHVLRGVEANIIAGDGTLDVDEHTLKMLDIGIASYHGGIFQPGTVVQNTEAYLKILENPYIDFIAHSGSPDFAYDYDVVLKRTRELGKLIEINEHTFSVRRRNVENCKTIAKKCMEYGVGVVVNTDAHICFDMGHYEGTTSMFAELGFPEELIVNQTVDRLMAYLNSRPGREKIEF